MRKVKDKDNHQLLRSTLTLSKVVPTDLNLGEAGVEDREEALRIFAKMARERNYGTRPLIKEEVGEAMMNSLKRASAN